jgi:hypothetical protein
LWNKLADGEIAALRKETRDLSSSSETAEIDFSETPQLRSQVHEKGTLVAS